MASSVTCPSCGRALSLPEDAEGRKVQCPTCGTAFDAAPVSVLPLGLDGDGEQPRPAIPDLPPPPKPLVAVLLDSSRDSPPADVEEEEDFERCPLCERRVPASADLCPACGTYLEAGADEDGSLRGPHRRDYEPHRAVLISGLGTASVVFGVIAALALCAAPFAAAGLIGAGIGGAALLMAREDLQQMDRNIMDPDGRRRTVAAQTNAMIGVSVSVIALVVGLLRALVYFERWL